MQRKRSKVARGPVAAAGSHAAIATKTDAQPLMVLRPGTQPVPSAQAALAGNGTHRARPRRRAPEPATSRRVTNDGPVAILHN